MSALGSSFEPLVEAAKRGGLVVLAGAGISKAPPSCLPDWTGFNRALLEAIKASALALPALPATASDAIRRLEVEDVGKDALSDAVVRVLAGERYFPLLTVLDSERTNENHRAIAALAQRGVVRAVVTTNFDTLLERAFREVGAACQVFAAPDDFRCHPNADCAVYKVHGSIAQAGTLVDTVSQKLRGLRLPVRARLIELYQRHHVLVLGFSGADLAFGADYLALAALRESGKGMTWIVLPGSKLNPRAEALLRSTGGAVVEAQLEEVFLSLGPPIADQTADIVTDGQSEADARARRSIDHWLADLGGGPLASILFCVVLVDALGWRDEAAALRRAVSAELDRRGGSVPILHALVAHNMLAQGAERNGDYESSEHWASRALALCDEFDRRGDAASELASSPGASPVAPHRVGSWISVARCRAHRGAMPAAREALARACAVAEHIRDDEALSQVLTNEALVLCREEASPEMELERLRRARRLAEKNGSVHVMTETALGEAYVLIRIGEYDAALRAIERAERTVHWSWSPETRLVPDLWRAAVALRRGRHDEATEGFERVIAKAAGDPVTATRLAMAAATELGVHSQTRPWARARLDALASPDDGRIRDGSAPRDDDFDTKVERIRQILANLSATDSFLESPPGVADAERELRWNLMKAEYERDAATAARALANLANARYDPVRPRRMLDLAEAALQAAERAGDRAVRHGILFLVAVARDLCGDLHGSIAASREILDAAPPADEDLRIRTSHSLALVLGKLGRRDEAERLFRAAIAHHAGTGDAARQTRSTIALADLLAGVGDVEGAETILRQGASAIERCGDPAAVAKRDDLLESLRRRRRGAATAPILLFAEEEVQFTAEEIRGMGVRCETAEGRCDVASWALGAGLTRAAVELLLDAQAALQRDGDLHGLARCFHLLADAAQADIRWDSAVDFTQHALTLEEELEDRPGQVASYAALALQSIEVNQLERARWAAGECLARAGWSDDSRFAVIARSVIAEALGRTGDDPTHAREAAETARAAARALANRSSVRAWAERRLAALQAGA